MQAVTQWKSFFSEFCSLWRRQSAEPTVHAAPSAYIDFFEMFAARYAPYRAQGRAVNFVQLAGIGNDELRNSALLAWLLDCSGSHGQETAFLRRFLDCVRGPGCPEGFPIGANSSSGYRTTVESSYDEEEQNGKQRSRVDVELDGSAFLLFIEIKIQAGEGEKQLARYLRIGRTRAGKRPWGLAFVTPAGREPVEKELCGKVACVSWRALGRSFLRHAETMPETHGSIIIRQICEHFIGL